MRSDDETGRGNDRAIALTPFPAAERLTGGGNHRRISGNERCVLAPTFLTTSPDEVTLGRPTGP